MKKQIIGWALVFILAGVWYSFAQTVCTESRCYKLQDELGFYIDTGNPLPVETHTFVAANTLCTENRCVKLVDKNGFYIDSNNPLPTTGGGGGGGGTVTSITFSSPLTGGTITTTGTVGCQVASGSLAGCLSSADWTTFNSKVGTARQINTTIPLGGGGSLSGDLTLTCSTCGITTNPLSQFASTTSAQLLATLSNPTGTGLAVFNNTPAITTPKITTGLFDANGVGIISWPLVASQVTNLLVTPSVSGNPSTLTLGPNSSDSNVNLVLIGKGSGGVCIISCSPATGPLTVGSLILNGATSGSLTQTVAAAVGGSFTITWPGGTTDFTATGGTSQFVKQGSAGGALTVVRPACADLSNAAASCSTDTTSATNITSGTLPAARMIAANMPVPSLTTGTTQTLLAPRGYAICTGTCTITVPVPAAGYEFCVMNDDNVSTAITLAALGSSAMYENTARTAYGTAGTGTLVSTAATANKICLLGRDSTHYLTVSFVGSWTAN